MSKPHITQFIVPRRDDLRKAHDFKEGDRVKHKEQTHWTGTVATLPSGAVAQVGPHVLGNEMGVDLDTGGRAVSDVDKWEKLT
jgi:hypothetical protein